MSLGQNPLSTIIGQSGSSIIDICVGSAVCDAANVSVQQMDSAFQAASSSVQAQYQATHDSIISSAAANAGGTWFGFDCCTMQSIGIQADALMNQIQKAMGWAVTAGASGGGSGGSGLDTNTLMTIALVVGAGVLLLSVAKR